MKDPRLTMERSPLGSRFFSSSNTLVVAVSTGVDSMVLLDLLQNLPKLRRPRLIVAHVNHHLRTQSTAEEAFLRTYCRQRNLPLEVAQWAVAEHPAKGIEAAARRFRYSFFATVMDKYQAQAVATAHHQDDLAETVLMKLIRGGRIEQLGALRWQRPFASGALIRPLLALNKQDLRRYAKDHQLTWFEDETNRDLTPFRNRVRHRYLPSLSVENPRLVTALASDAEQINDLLGLANERLGELDATLRTERGFSLAAFRRLSESTQRSYLRYYLTKRGVATIKEEQLHQLVTGLGDQTRPPQSFQLPNRWCLVKGYREAFLKKAGQMAQEGESEGEFVVELGQWYRLRAGGTFSVTRQPGQGLVTTVWLTNNQFPLTCRPVQAGDRLLLKGGTHQRVRRVLIDQKVPRDLRANQRVIVDALGQVVWLVGVKVAWFDRRPGALPVALCQREQ